MPTDATSGFSARHWLVLILLFAAALRLPLAFVPNAYVPDEIFQYLEPAWRLLGHDSIVSWEWRFGIRSWALPTLFAAPVALGDWLAPGGMGAFVVPRLIAAVASLSIVFSAWKFGARQSRTHAIVAGFVAAIWFEFIFLAPRTLSEPLATACIFPAVWLLTQAAPTPRQLAAAGFLLGVGFVFRFQYAPAIAVIALGSCWRDWRRLIPAVLGGMLALAATSAIDVWHGDIPLRWLFANVQQNLFHNRAADFGVHPAFEYMTNFVAFWSVAIVPLVLAIWKGWRHAPVLLAAALVNLLVHSIIGHKEHRFIFLSVVFLVTLAALGSADWVAQMRRRANMRAHALPLAIGLWLSASAVLAATGYMPELWQRGTGASRLADELRSDPALCGIATYETPFVVLVGQQRLAGTKPLYALTALDPATANDPSAALRKAQAGFNRIVSREDLASAMPDGFTPSHCEMLYDKRVCIYARPGRCEATAAAPYAINDVLIRIDR